MRSTLRNCLALAISLAAVAVACTDDSATGDADPTDTSSGEERDATIDVGREDPDGNGQRGGSRGRQFLRLAPFADCTAFLDHVKWQAHERVGPYGLDPTGFPWPLVAATRDASAVAEVDFAAPAATEAPASEATSEASGGWDDADSGSGDASAIAGTNTQEQGVDEPDIVKTDGNRIVIISENVLTHVDITGGQPVVTGQLTIPEGWGHQLFLDGDRALLLTNSGSWATPMPVDVAMPTTVAPVTDAEAAFAPDATEDLSPSGMGSVPAASIIEVDLSQPSELRIAATLRIEGQYLNARAIGGRLLLAVSSGPQWMPWLYPQNITGEQAAIDANRALIDRSVLSDWVPQYELATDGGTTGGDLLDCNQLQHPADFSGFDVISVVGIDLTSGLADGFERADTSGVLAGGQTVYASLDRFYVATTRWLAADASVADDMLAMSNDYETDLHAFAITAGNPVQYLASGSVPGTLLNSFSLDEHEGYLRVITTDGTPWDQSNVSETRLTVFAEQGELLTPVGEVGGLGRGEALYSARLVGDRGFAVTFRQVDPFYVLDLSDPTAPQVTGELKIPGFSTYLHPVGDHRVLGVGRAATEDGMVTGLKLSLFDVADPANPLEISTWTLDDAQSAAEYDHHAFQMIGSTAILPVQSYTDSFNGAIVLDIGDQIVERGRITHEMAIAEPTSECREIVEGDLPETSPGYWLAVDTYTRAQLCTAGQASGFGDWYCDVVPATDIPAWVGGGDDFVAELTALNGGELARLEMCYPVDDWSDAIQRSVVIDDTLWTMSGRSLQANDLASLELLGAVALR
jgi:hypothetical protein